MFHRSENRVTTGQIRKLLKRIAGGVHKILNRLENLDPNDWKVWKDLVDVSVLNKYRSFGSGQLSVNVCSLLLQ